MVWAKVIEQAKIDHTQVVCIFVNKIVIERFLLHIIHDGDAIDSPETLSWIREDYY